MLCCDVFADHPSPYVVTVHLCGQCCAVHTLLYICSIIITQFVLCNALLYISAVASVLPFIPCCNICFCQCDVLDISSIIVQFMFCCTAVQITVTPVHLILCRTSLQSLVDILGSGVRSTVTRVHSGLCFTSPSLPLCALHAALYISTIVDVHFIL